jgi:hypothetical protein
LRFRPRLFSANNLPFRPWVFSAPPRLRGEDWIWFSDSGDLRKTRGATGVPDEPDVGLAGWNFAAPQTVILKERPFLPRMKDLNREAIPLPRLARPLPPPGGIPPHPSPSQFGVSSRGTVAIHPTLACTSATKAPIGADLTKLRGVKFAASNCHRSLCVLRVLCG